MSEIKIIELEESDMLTNDEAAMELRDQLKDMGVFMLNVMGAPGAGKTELLCNTAGALKGAFQVGCMCTDLDTTLDAQRLSGVCDHVIQLHAGGMWPYVSADGSRENLGVLISAAAWDTGATMNVVVTSASGGVHTALKYYYMFAICDAVIITKSDLADSTDFKVEECMTNIRSVNDNAEIFVVSSKTGKGMEAWTDWLAQKIKEHIA